MKQGRGPGVSHFVVNEAREGGPGVSHFVVNEARVEGPGVGLGFSICSGGLMNVNVHFLTLACSEWI